MFIFGDMDEDETFGELYIVIGEGPEAKYFRFEDQFDISALIED